MTTVMNHTSASFRPFSSTTEKSFQSPKFQISRFTATIPDLQSLPTDIRDRMLAVQEKIGFVPNIFLALAHRPDEFRSFFMYHDALMNRKESQLTKAEREMIVVSTSGKNQCQYCVVAHGAALRILTKSPSISEQIAINFRKTELTPRQQAILTFAAKVSESSNEVNEDDIDNLKKVGLNEDTIWDIISITSFFSMSNRLANSISLVPNSQFYSMAREFKGKENETKKEKIVEGEKERKQRIENELEQLKKMSDVIRIDIPAASAPSSFPIVKLVLNRPEARNALTVSLMTTLSRHLHVIDGDPSVRCVILAGNGPAFCSGHDLKEMRGMYNASQKEQDQNKKKELEKKYRDLFDQCSQLMQQIVYLRAPVIAQVHGIATAAGCQLVNSCDIAIASNDAKFATPGVNIGLFCSTPQVALSRTIHRKKAMEMLLTGDTVSSEDALRYGMINRRVESGQLENEVLSLAQKIVSKSGYVVSLGKKGFYQQIEMPLPYAYKHCSEIMTRNMLSSEAHEGICSFLDKREPKWKHSDDVSEPPRSSL